MVVDVAQWKHIEEHHGEYYISDTRITVGEIVHWLEVDDISPEELSEGWGIKLESVEEAIDFYEKRR